MGFGVPPLRRSLEFSGCCSKGCERGAKISNKQGLRVGFVGFGDAMSLAEGCLLVEMVNKTAGKP